MSTIAFLVLTLAVQDTVPGKFVTGTVVDIDDYGERYALQYGHIILRQMDGSYAVIYLLKEDYLGMRPITEARAARVFTMALTSSFLTFHELTREANAWWAPYYVVRFTEVRTGR